MQIKSYNLGDVCIEYLIDENNYISLQMFPESKKELRTKPWELEPPPFKPNERYLNGWFLGRLAYYHLVGHDSMAPAFTMKNFDLDLRLESQNISEKDGKTVIETLMTSDEGCKVMHRLTYICGLGGFEVETEFVNNSGKDVTLDMLTSFTLDNLSPFQMDDAPNTYSFHRFYGGWSKEGKPVSQTIEDLSLEKPWCPWQQCANNERFGAVGSYSTRRFFPTAVFEDKKAGVMWGAQMASNSTWQMELTRWDDSLSFTGGPGDREFCGWKKNVKNGESFKAPKAYIAVSDGGLEEVCARLTDMHKTARKAYGEQGIPTSFNEYCATWGTPTQEKMLNFCKILKPYDIKYLVIDAGWCNAGCEQEGNGEWNIDKSIFPDVKAMNKTIRENGMIPGIWFEFEVTTDGSKMFMPEYDFMHLTKDGHVLKSWHTRSYWDFRREDVREYLYEKVINFLKDNDFGYIKVDYNANIGMEIDGAESGAEALRQHLECVRDFFKLMKKEIPDLVIENCASGGNRNDPSMLGVAAMGSFSDAHESVEIPYIAANMHYLMLPAQSLVWCVVREDDTKDRLAYSLAATFLGRVCLSGDIDKAPEWQCELIKDAMDFYKNLENIIENGRTKLYGNRSNSMRYPTGIQAIARKTEDEMMVVYHAFDGDIIDLEIDIPDGFKLADSFNADKFIVSDSKVKIIDAKPLTAGAVLLRK